MLMKDWLGESVLIRLLENVSKLAVSSESKKLLSRLYKATIVLVNTVTNLHEKNIEIVAQFLTHEFGISSASTFCFELLAQGIFHVPSITIAVWQPETLTDKILLGSAADSNTVHDTVVLNEDLKLDRRACGASINVSKEGFGASQVGNEKWGIVRGEVELPSQGVSSWDVVIETSPKGHIFLGVATAYSTLDSYLGNDKHGWGYIGNRGAWHNRHKTKTYGQDFRSGDRITVKIDMDIGGKHLCEERIY